jgi:hypothetical protein
MDLKKLKPENQAQKWGWGIAIFSIFGIISGISFGIIEVALGYILGVGLGVYFILSPAPQAFLDRRRKNKSDQAERDIQSALRTLEKATGARAVIAYENLERIVKKTQKGNLNRLDELLRSINFDKSRVESKFIGSVANLGAPIFASAHQKTIRVFRDWVIAGDLGFDFDVSTRGQVNVDGSITFDKKNNKVDTRTATLQLATQDWSHAFKIIPDQADEARRIINQLSAIIDEMKPKGVTAADIQDAMSKLINNSGKSPAQKLEELSNLRYQRLLTDQEFEAAKSKILGL